MMITGFKYLLRQSLQSVLVQVVPFLFQLIRPAADVGAPSGRPGVQVECDEVT